MKVAVITAAAKRCDGSAIGTDTADLGLARHLNVGSDQVGRRGHITVSATDVIDAFKQNEVAHAGLL